MPKQTAESQAMGRFLDYLRGEGFRVTEQRLQVASALFRARGHLSAEALCDAVRRRNPEVSRASVYRTLELLSRSGLAEGTAFESDRKLYEPVCGRAHHDHLVCVECGAVEEFHHKGIEAAQKSVATDRGFDVRWHSLKIYGTCRKCGRAAGRESRTG